MNVYAMQERIKHLEEQVRLLRAADPTRLLTSDEIAERLCVSKRTFFRLVESGRFPQPIRYSRKLVRWKESDVRAYLNAQGAL